MRRLIGTLMLAFLLLGCGDDDTEEPGGSTMPTDPQQRITDAVQAEQGWDAGDVVIDPVDGAAGACSLHVASHRTMPMSFPPSYAVLPDGQLVAESDDDAAQTILNACGDDGDERFWAEVVVRFHPDARPGTVVVEAAEAQLAVRKAEEAGEPFHAPRFVDGPDRGIEFFAMNFESNHLSRVVATASDGALTVEKTQLT